ncbi:MAG: hypothetical protein ABJB66_04155 [Gemmatimonadaceae bacterium]
MRTLTTLAASTDTLGLVIGVRQLKNGQLLVSDGGHRRLLMLDPTLRTTSVVLDSAPGKVNSYGSRATPILAYLGDSSLIFDFAAQTMVLIGPSGAVGRAMAVPNPRDLQTMAGSLAGIDDRGRFVYRGLSRKRGGKVGANASPLMVVNDNTNGTQSNADSVPLLRVDFQSRQVDTIADLKNFFSRRIQLDSTPEGRPIIRSYNNPAPLSDEWAMLSDGTIAMVRGHDYHVDWLASDGRISSTGKTPFDWKRLTDDDKRRMIDSARVRDSLETETRLSIQRAAEARAKAAGRVSNASTASGRGGGEPNAFTSNRPGGLPIMQTKYVALSEMPDYLPPVRNGALRGDADDNLWILPTTSAQSQRGELVYDVVNRKGELFERVRIPLGRVIAGFGQGGIVYLTSGSIKGGFHLERAKIAK